MNDEQNQQNTQRGGLPSVIVAGGGRHLSLITSRKCFNTAPMPQFLIPLVFVSLLPSLSAAGPERLKPVPTHFVMHTEHVLRPEEQAQLTAEGVEIQHVLPGNRYVVRTANRESLDAELLVQSIEELAPSRKLHPTAYADIARGRTFTRLRLVFHDDVSFEDAQRAIEGVGGFVERPLAVDFDVPHGLQVRIP